MRSLFIILGIIAAVLALVLAVTPLSQFAYFPAVAALIFGGIAFYISRQIHSSKKSIHLIFLLTFISLVLTTYKVVFVTAEVGNIEELELKEETSLEESKDILEGLDLDETDTTDYETIKPEELPDLEGLDGLKDF